MRVYDNQIALDCISNAFILCGRAGSLLWADVLDCVFGGLSCLFAVNFHERAGQSTAGSYLSVWGENIKIANFAPENADYLFCFV